jgi:hypothetical protein
MARAVSSMEVGINFNPTKPTKSARNRKKSRDQGSSAAYGIVFGLLCSLIAWMFLAYGIYRIHALFIAVR